MVRAYIKEDQTDWDQHLDKLAYAYNSSVHETIKQTPFEMMFLRKPKIPIDLIIPPIENTSRERMHRVRIENTEKSEVEVLDDIEVEVNMPENAKQYLADLKSKMQDCFKRVENERDLVMDKKKLQHDRSIKKTEYQIGDLVLSDHPKTIKGLSHGLAKKWRGPFVIVGKNKNGIDYLIKECGKRNAKAKQLHISHLKTYFDRGRPNKWLKTADDRKLDKSTQTNKKLNQVESIAKVKITDLNKIAKKIKASNLKHNIRKDKTGKIAKKIETQIKRPYNKNPTNPRWNKIKIKPQESKKIDKSIENGELDNNKVRRSERLKKNKQKN